MAMQRAPQLKGMESAPEFYIDGIANIQFQGVNTRFVLYRNATDAKGAAFRQVVFTAVGPTGSLVGALRQLVSFATEHRLPTPIHDATR